MQLKSQLKVVYVDDEADLCEMFAELFATESISVQTFVDPVKAVEQINEQTPDLIFLDYRLPHTNGEKIAHALNLKIPIVLITGEMAFEPTYPFFRVLGKPYETQQVEKILSEVSAFSLNPAK